MCQEYGDYSAIPIGKFTDKFISSTLHLPISRIEKERRKLKIPPFRGNIKKVEWDCVPFEERSNSYISNMLDIPTNSVFRKRRKLKRPRVINKFKPVCWDDLPLGDVDDRIIFEKIRKEHGISSHCSVSKARTLRGIPNFWEWSIDWDSQPLGMIQDAILAKSLILYGHKNMSMHCPVSQVSKQRKKRGIPVCISTIKCIVCGEEIKTIYPGSRIKCTNGRCAKIIEKANYKSGGFKEIRPMMISLTKLESEITTMKGIADEN